MSWLLVSGMTGSVWAEEMGSPVRYVTAIDLAGDPHRLCAEGGTKATALVFMTTECPISRQYIPELNRLSAEFVSQGVEFLGVISDATTTRAAAARFCDEFKVVFPVLFDASGELAMRYEPTHVPEAFVLNGNGVEVYRGRIDDVYATIDRRRQEPTQRDLREALLATVAGREVKAARTEPVGCPLETPGEGSAGEVTYTRDIAPILYANCAECHRPGEVAPFSLLTYEDAAKRAEWLSEITRSGLMPPWRAATGHVAFLGERRLSPDAIALIEAWAEAGAPEGDLDDLPPPPKFASGWRLGEPDLVLRAPSPFTVPADGPDIFQHFVIPMDLPDDKTLVGFEFRPGNPAVVHHAVLLLDSMGVARAKDAETPEPGYTTFGSIGVPSSGILGVWTPGMTPNFMPEGIGQVVPAGSDLLLQLHMHPSGKEESDQSTIGLYFSDEPPTRTVSRSPLVLGTLILDIPPGEARHEIASSVTLPTDITLLSVLPHMHLIGKEMKVTATFPDGKELPIIWIEDWNFYWQDNYVYKQPLDLPAGTRLDVVSAYNNSAENPLNPTSPPKRVLFGNGSTDEMCFAIFQLVANAPDGQQKLQQSLVQSFMKQWGQANLDEEARKHIIDEAMKLFGGGDADASRFLQLFGRGRSDRGT